MTTKNMKGFSPHKLLLILVGTKLSSTGDIVKHDYDCHRYPSLDGGQDLPAFLTSPQQIQARLGEDLHLPCETSATGIKKVQTCFECTL